MYSYHAFGLAISSEIPLPELTVSAGRPDVKIRLGVTGQAPVEAFRNRPYLEVRTNCAVLSVENAGTFVVRDGREILVIPENGVDAGLRRRYLCGTVMGLLLDQRDLLVLHASSVAINGRAYAFLGHQGSGKSSIASILQARGHRFLCDDVAAVRLAAGEAWIYPAFPQMKLSLETAAAAGLAPEALFQLDDFEDKRGYRLPGHFAVCPVPLTAIFVVSPPERTSREPLGPQEVVHELLCHSFPTRLGQPGDGRHLLKCASLSRQVPLYRLPRARSLAELPAFAQTVEHLVRDLQERAKAAPMG